MSHETGIQTPSTLEKTSYGQQGWNAIHSSNMEKLNDFWQSLVGPLSVSQVWDHATQSNVRATKYFGEVAVADPATITAVVLTDNSGGTADDIIEAISGSGADGPINNNFAEVADEINKLRADNVVLRNVLISLLIALRKTGGNGVLSD